MGTLRALQKSGAREGFLTFILVVNLLLHPHPMAAQETEPGPGRERFTIGNALTALDAAEKEAAKIASQYGLANQAVAEGRRNRSEVLRVLKTTAQAFIIDQGEGQDSRVIGNVFSVGLPKIDPREFRKNIELDELVVARGEAFLAVTQQLAEVPEFLPIAMITRGAYLYSGKKLPSVSDDWQRFSTLAISCDQPNVASALADGIAWAHGTDLAPLLKNPGVHPSSYYAEDLESASRTHSIEVSLPSFPASVAQLAVNTGQTSTLQTEILPLWASLTEESNLRTTAHQSAKALEILTGEIDGIAATVAAALTDLATPLPFSDCIWLLRARGLNPIEVDTVSVDILHELVQSESAQARKLLGESEALFDLSEDNTLRRASFVHFVERNARRLHLSPSEQERDSLAAFCAAWIRAPEVAVGLRYALYESAKDTVNRENIDSAMTGIFFELARLYPDESVVEAFDLELIGRQVISELTEDPPAGDLLDRIRLFRQLWFGFWADGISDVQPVGKSLNYALLLAHRTDDLEWIDHELSKFTALYTFKAPLYGWLKKVGREQHARNLLKTWGSAMYYVNGTPEQLPNYVAMLEQLAANDSPDQYDAFEQLMWAVSASNIIEEHDAGDRFLAMRKLVIDAVRRFSQTEFTDLPLLQQGLNLLQRIRYAPPYAEEAFNQWKKNLQFYHKLKATNTTVAYAYTDVRSAYYEFYATADEITHIANHLVDSVATSPEGSIHSPPEHPASQFWKSSTRSESHTVAWSLRRMIEVNGADKAVPWLLQLQNALMEKRDHHRVHQILSNAVELAIKGLTYRQRFEFLAALPEDNTPLEVTIPLDYSLRSAAVSGTFANDQTELPQSTATALTEAFAEHPHRHWWVAWISKTFTEAFLFDREFTIYETDWHGNEARWVAEFEATLRETPWAQAALEFSRNPTTISPTPGPGGYCYEGAPIRLKISAFDHLIPISGGHLEGLSVEQKSARVYAYCDLSMTGLASTHSWLADNSLIHAIAEIKEVDPERFHEITSQLYSSLSATTLSKQDPGFYYHMKLLEYAMASRTEAPAEALLDQLPPMAAVWLLIERGDLDEARSRYLKVNLHDLQFQGYPSGFQWSESFLEKAIGLARNLESDAAVGGDARALALELSAIQLKPEIYHSRIHRRPKQALDNTPPDPLLVNFATRFDALPHTKGALDQWVFEQLCTHHGIGPNLSRRLALWRAAYPDNFEEFITQLSAPVPRRRITNGTIDPSIVARYSELLIANGDVDTYDALLQPIVRPNRNMASLRQQPPIDKVCLSSASLLKKRLAQSSLNEAAPLLTFIDTLLRKAPATGQETMRMRSSFDTSARAELAVWRVGFTLAISGDTSPEHLNALCTEGQSLQLASKAISEIEITGAIWESLWQTLAHAGQELAPNVRKELFETMTNWQPLRRIQRALGIQLSPATEYGFLDLNKAIGRAEDALANEPSSLAAVDLALLKCQNLEFDRAQELLKQLPALPAVKLPEGIREKPTGIVLRSAIHKATALLPQSDLLDSQPPLPKSNQSN